MNIVTGLLVGGVFFLVAIKSYTLGLQHGRKLSNGIIPTINLNPVTEVIKHVEAKKEEKEVESAINEYWR